MNAQHQDSSAPAMPLQDPAGALRWLADLWRRPRGTTTGLVWIGLQVAATALLAGLVGYASQAHKSYDQQVEQLRREAGLKALTVQGWAERHVAQARLLSADPLLRATLQRWQHSPDATATAEMRRQLQQLLASTHTADVLLLDDKARLLLAADEAPRQVDAALAEGVQAALQRNGVTTSDFHAESGAAAALRFDLFVPLLGGDGRNDAVLVLRTAPSRMLLPLLLSDQPGVGPRTLLFRPLPQGVQAVGIGRSDAALMRTADPSAAGLAALRERPDLAGSLMQGLGQGDEASAAVAVPVAQSRWYVAVQTPLSTLQGGGLAGGASSAFAGVLALLASGAIVYPIIRRRERQASSRSAADQLLRDQALRTAEAITNCSTDIIFAKDLQGRYIFVNRELCRVVGQAHEALIGADCRALFPAGQVRRLLEDDAAALQAEQPISVETRLKTPEGERIYACTKGRLTDAVGRTIGTYGISRDVTESRDLRQRMRQWAMAFESIRDAVVVTDALGRMQSVNRAFSTITGYTPEEALGSTMKLLHSGRHGREFYKQMWAAIRETGQWQGEIWNRRKDGDIYPEWLTISAVSDEGGPVTHYVGVFTDISRIKDSEAQADWLVHHDPLTRLPNRVHLQRRLEHALARSRRRETRAVLMVIDLDSFKTVNDGLGHPAGDELLVCVADRLKAHLRPTDFLGRLGGDEFLVILEAQDDPASVAAFARDLITAVSAPIPLSCHKDAFLTASIGISMFPDDGSPTAVELLRDADAALYRAKELGRNRFCFYTGDMNTKAVVKLELEAALSRAIERNELLLHYQPKVDGVSGEVVGAEALLRWNRTGLGLVPPGDFIPVAEQSSLILAIGAWVIDAACRQLRAWIDAGAPVVRIAVNVAAPQFATGDLDAVVGWALAQHRVPAEYLELELTEGMLIGNPRAGQQMLQRLRELGVKVSLDDFGTGYSSLAYLQQFPLDALKIDRSFVQRIGEQPDGEALVDAIIALAHRLRLRVVAEGVETAAQTDYLRSQGCDEMQGYHFGKPVPAELLEARLVAERDSVAA